MGSSCCCPKVDNFSINISNNENHNKKDILPTNSVENLNENNNDDNSVSNFEKKDNDCITFLFNNTKELHLSVLPNNTFNEVIEQLKVKYLWIQNYDELTFLINGANIEKNKTVEELGIKNDDVIIINGN